MLKKFDAKNWVDPESYYFDRIIINQNTITARHWTWVFGKNKLMGQCSFTVKFIKIIKWVGLGLVDTKNKIVQRNNHICYFSDGEYYSAG